MSRVLSTYALATRGGATAQPDSLTSSGTADIHTFAAPASATAVLVSVKATNARVTFDGTNPVPGTPHGVVLIAGAQPIFLPFAATIKFCSDVAGSSELSPLWLE